MFSVFLLTSGVLSVRQLRPQSEPREGKSLVNTFPFNSNIQHDHHNHHDDHVPGQALDARNQRQGSAERVPNFSEVAAARPDPNNDGKRCIDKVVMVDVIEYDEEVHCDHSYDTRCHTTYVTNYESQQEEECEENYRWYLLWWTLRC